MEIGNYLEIGVWRLEIFKTQILVFTFLFYSMAFYKILCAQCRHTFYRVEVRCGEYPERYECPECGAVKTKKVFVPPKKDEVAAETKECCRGTHFRAGGCGKCAGSD